MNITSFISSSAQAFGRVFEDATPTSIGIGLGAVTLTVFVLKRLSSKREETLSLEEATMRGDRAAVARVLEARVDRVHTLTGLPRDIALIVSKQELGQNPADAMLETYDSSQRVKNHFGQFDTHNFSQLPVIDIGTGSERDINPEDFEGRFTMRGISRRGFPFIANLVLVGEDEEPFFQIQSPAVDNPENIVKLCFSNSPSPKVGGLYELGEK